MINSDVTEFPFALWQQEEKDAMIFAELEKDQPGAVTKTVETVHLVSVHFMCVAHFCSYGKAHYTVQ